MKFAENLLQIQPVDDCSLSLFVTSCSRAADQASDRSRRRNAPAAACFRSSIGQKQPCGDASDPGGGRAFASNRLACLTPVNSIVKNLRCFFHISGHPNERFVLATISATDLRSISARLRLQRDLRDQGQLNQGPDRYLTQP